MNSSHWVTSPNLKGLDQVLDESRYPDIKPLFDMIERLACEAETNHKFSFHDDGFRFHTCACQYLEVFYVRT